MGFTVPVAFGGQANGLAASAAVVGQVAQGCPSTALILAMQFTKQAALARNAGYSAALRERIGRKAARDGALLNAIRVEPELGSPTRGSLPATWNTALLGSLYDGIARKGRDWIVGFLRGRAPSNLGKTLASLPRMQETVGEIEALQRASHGEQPFWAAITLGCLIGQVGLPGGGFALGYGPMNTQAARIHALAP